MVNINLFGGPGIGKSTIASGLFYNMKLNDYYVEYVQEYAKELTFGKDMVKLSDQLLVLGEQHHRVHRLKNQVDYIIHDSPFIMGLCYLLDDEHLPKEEYKNLIVKMFHTYENVNIFLNRNENRDYQNYGRRENIAEARIKDDEIYDMLVQNNIPFYNINVNDKTVEKIMEILRKHENI